MNEKEAKRIIANIESGQYHLGQADGYLLAIEKAKGLVEVLDDVKYSLENIWSIDWLKFRVKFLDVSREALAKWEEEK